MPGGHSSLLWNMVHTENLWKIRQLPPSIQAAIIYAIIQTQITRLAEPPVRTIVVCWGKNGKFPMKVEVVKIKTWSAYFVDAGWGWGDGSVFQLHSIWLSIMDFLFLLKSQTDSCFSSSKTVFLFNSTYIQRKKNNSAKKHPVCPKLWFPKPSVIHYRQNLKMRKISNYLPTVISQTVCWNQRKIENLISQKSWSWSPNFVKVMKYPRHMCSLPTTESGL